MESDFDRRLLLTFDLCKFQKCEAQNEGSRATTHIRRRDTEVDMVVAHHLGGRLGVVVGVERWGGKWRRLRMRKSTPRKYS